MGTQEGWGNKRGKMNDGNREDAPRSDEKAGREGRRGGFHVFPSPRSGNELRRRQQTRAGINPTPFLNSQSALLPSSPHLRGAGGLVEIYCVVRLYLQVQGSFFKSKIVWVFHGRGGKNVLNGSQRWVELQSFLIRLNQIFTNAP